MPALVDEGGAQSGQVGARSDSNWAQTDWDWAQTDESKALAWLVLVYVLAIEAETVETDAVGVIRLPSISAPQ